MKIKNEQDAAKSLRAYTEKHLVDNLFLSANYFVKQGEWEDGQIAFEAKDLTNIIRIWALLNNNKFELAKKIAWNLDTANREMIPDDVWDYLTK